MPGLQCRLNAHLHRKIRADVPERFLLGWARDLDRLVWRARDTRRATLSGRARAARRTRRRAERLRAGELHLLRSRPWPVGVVARALFVDPRPRWGGARCSP